MVGWLQEFGVITATRFTRMVDGHMENNSTILLMLNQATCPSKIEPDYVTYHVLHTMYYVRTMYCPYYVPLVCHKCGKFGHDELRCNAEAICLNCGDMQHEGSCQAKCVSCGKSVHSCRSRECSVEKE